MPIDEETVPDLIQRSYRAGERSHPGIEPAEVRARTRIHRGVLPDMKMLGLVVAVAALILAGFLVVPSLHSVGRSAISPSTTSSVSSSSATSAAALASTLACTLSFAPGTSQPDTALVGLSLAAAEAQVSAASQIWRIVGQDGQCADVTADGVFRRVDLWVVSGIVVQAVLELPPT